MSYTINNGGITPVEVLEAGTRGAKGWNPVVTGVEDGNRRLIYIDWEGGIAPKPVAGYVGKNSLVATIDNVDIVDFGAGVEAARLEVVSMLADVTSKHSTVLATSDTVEAKRLETLNYSIQAAASAAAAAAIVQGSATTRPSIRPALMLDLTSEVLDPRITFTRNDANRSYFNSKGIMQVAKANEWPRDFDPITGRCLGRANWESRTNVVLWNRDFTNASWSKSGSSVVGGFLAPDGTTNMAKITEDTSTGSHIAISSSLAITANLPYTSSMYLAASGRTSATLTFVNAVNWPGSINPSVTFNLSTGVVTAVSGSSTSGKTKHIGGGVWRCEITATSTTTGTTNLAISTHNGSTTSYTGDGVSGILAWGAQLENGIIASPVIPTTTAAVTRAREDVSIEGVNFSDWYNQAEGTLGVIATPNTYTNSPLIVMASLNDASFNNRITMALTAGNNPRFHILRNSFGAGLITTPINTNTMLSNAINIAIMAYNSTSIALVSNGGTVTEFSHDLAPMTRIEIGGQFSSALANGPISQIVYWPKRLSNTELQALTTSGLLAGKNPNQLPTVGDLGDLATASWKQLLGTLLPTLTIEQLRYSFGNPAKAVLISDVAKVGIFVRDNADTSSADDGQNVIVTSDTVPVRFKRRQLLRNYTPTSGADTTMELGSVVYDSDFLHVKTAGATIQKLQMPKSGATGARPATSALPVPYMYYDTTLSKPVWWNGTVWKDATGATV